MGKYFGTDGIRGTFGDERINCAFAARFGAAVALYNQRVSSGASLLAVIGRDTRESGAALVGAIIDGLQTQGIEVFDLGIVPTPAVATTLLLKGADFGIVVTASHNPADDNGFKLFDRSGCKLSESAEAQIEELIDRPVSAKSTVVANNTITSGDASLYLDKMTALLQPECLAGWKVVLDLANGATVKTTPLAFRRWGAEVITLGDEPDGININQRVGSEYPVQLGKAVRAHSAHLGIAHDGDGDRIVVCDEHGDLIDGDVLLGLYALHALDAGRLTNNTLVATIQSNLGLDFVVQEAGGTVLRANVGDRNVASLMRENGATIGGESSGHIIFSDYATTGDGLLAASRLVELMRHFDESLSALRKRVELFPQETANLMVEEKRLLQELPNLKNAIQEGEHVFGKEGRVLVRYSGTEPKLRLLAEGRDPVRVKNVLKSLILAAKIDLIVIDD